MAAAARAIATRADRRLIDDPFAEPLVRAVGVDLLTRPATGEVAPDDLVGQVFIDVAKVRTKFYDEFFLDATKAGNTQAVILASGLDSRAYRLRRPIGTVVYEVDQPQVIEFKTRALAELGAAPTADRRVAAVDLRDDWPTALLDTITELSAPGSRVATENRPNPRPGDEDKTRERLHRIAERWRAHSFDSDMARLRYFGERNEAAPYLTDRGWALTGISIRDLLAANDLPPLKDDDMRMGDMLYISGALDRTTK
jgi:O-methyltransferase involved in polyketide biosynthesis